MNNFVLTSDIDGWSLVGRCLQCLDPATGNDATIFTSGGGAVILAFGDRRNTKQPIALATAIVTLVAEGFPRPPQVLLKQFAALVNQ